MGNNRIPGKVLLPFLFVVLFAQVTLAQTGSITGTVTNQKGEPIPTANVLLVEINRGAATTVQGKYTIEDVSAGTYTLRISFVGYQEYSDQVTISSGKTVTKDVTLESGAVNLQELVVTGYGVTERANLTSSIASVGRTEIAASPVENVDNLLQGKAPGVLVSKNSGTPGGGVLIRIRGTSSITASQQPLYIVDGVPLNSGGGAAIGVGGQQLNPIANLSPSAIKSIEVLKGASATAIYGTRGANGVVLITTREGQSGETQISVNYSHGVSETINKRNMLNSAGHIKMYVDGMYADFNRIDPRFTGLIPNPYKNWGTYQERYQTLKNKLAKFGLSFADYGLPVIDKYGANPSEAPTTDWQDAVFQAGFTNDFTITASGGTEDTQFFTSGSYYHEQGTMIQSAIEKLNGRLNVNHQFNERLNMDVNMSLSRTINNRIENDNNIYGVLSTASLAFPTRPIYNDDGTYNKSTGTFANPVAEAQAKNKAVRTRFIGNAEIEYEIAENLFINGSAGIDYFVLKEEGYFPSFTSQGAPSGVSVGSAGFNQTWVVEAGLAYRNTINEIHDLRAQVILSYQESGFERVFTQGIGFPSDAFKTITSAATTSGSSLSTSNGLASYIGDINYVYNDRYVLSLTTRIDASSRFSENNRYAFFPAVGVAWRISNEQFMDNINWISNLKLRAGFGITGNQGIGDFSYQALYQGSTYSGTTALVPSQIANPDLKWEETTQYEAGIDVGLFDERISATLNVYYKKTKDLLLFRPIPATTGFTNFSSNIGSMKNKGIEFTFTTINIQQKDFQWSTTFNISANKNSVTKLYQGQPINSEDYPSSIREGYPIGVFRAYLANGLWNSQQEIDEYLAADPDHSVGNARPGDVRFVDINGDGVITPADQTILGQPQPDFYGGLRNQLSYKGFELNIFFQFNYGGKIFNATRQFTEHYGFAYAANTTALDRWTPTNKDTDTYRASALDRHNNTRNSSLFLEDGSYLRLESLTLAYNFGTEILDNFGIRSLRIYATAYNLLTFDNYSGLDPEVNTLPGSNFERGNDFLTYPQSRSLIIGINLRL